MPFINSIFRINIADVIRIAWMFLIIVGTCTTGNGAFAQTQEGSVQTSWDKSQKNPVNNNTMRQKPAEKKSYWDKDSVTYWKKTHPQKPAQPATEPGISAKNLYQANDVLIDSLLHLYCVSSNYIVDLRIQNHIAFDQPPETAVAQQGSSAPQQKSTKTSLADPQALHNKLVELLNRCLRRK